MLANSWYPSQDFEVAVKVFVPREVHLASRKLCAVLWFDFGVARN